MKKTRFKFLEPSLAIGLMLAILTGAYACRTQQELSSKLLRLHIVAHSDSKDDQALKLRVRDRVIQTAQSYLTDITDVRTAQQIVLEHIPELEAVAKDEVSKSGFSYPVNAKVTNMYFPTRDYDTFSLPAGNYNAFRVEIGDAKGRNWWCVMFPPLCITAAQADIDSYELTDEELALISSGDTVYKCKFKAVELFSKIYNLLKK